MGGVAKAVGKVVDAVVDTTKAVVKTAWNITENTIKMDFKELAKDFKEDMREVGYGLADITRQTARLAGELLAEPLDLIGADKFADFTRNVFNGFGENLAKAIEGIAEGKWSKFRDGIIGAFTTVLYVIGGAIGVMTGNYWLVMAAVIALDGQYNNGELTMSAIKILGKAEEAIFGTTYLQDYAEEVAMLIIIVASIYAGGKGFGYLSDIAGISAYLSKYQTFIALYGIYDAYDQYMYWKDWYKAQLDEYMAWAKQQMQYYAQSRHSWFELYSNIENQEVLYESMAGGILFNAGAGSDEYSVSTIHEQSAYILTLDTKRDIDLDRTIFFNSEVDYLKLQLDTYKEAIPKWA